ncbi:hypothetical protein [Cohnella sp. GCM10027633]|uniref:hypothetical protein n=1 Tax=unclassified Cohnella TaxID=2636738 RepID=UPI0036255B76
MMTVRDARYSRVLDRGGHRIAEVEVFTGHPRDPQFFAYFTVGADGSYKLANVLANDADAEIDWFDNNLHSAYADVGTQMFSGPDHLGLIDREQFTSRLLAMEGISEALGRHLKRSTND